MVVYNDTSQEWFNVSAAGYGDAGQAAYGAGLLVPYYGSQGLFFALGGVTADGYTSFNEAQMYDPASREWLTQTTTGDIPPQRQQHCVVGQKGDNATYEVCSRPLPATREARTDKQPCLPACTHTTSNQIHADGC